MFILGEIVDALQQLLDVNLGVDPRLVVLGGAAWAATREPV